jgi:hypothetical protein
MFTPLTSSAGDQLAQIIEILDQKVKEAGANGMSESGQAKLRNYWKNTVTYSESHSQKIRPSM